MADEEARLRRSRGGYRSQVSKQITQLENETKEAINIERVKELLKRLKEKEESVYKLDNLIIEVISQTAPDKVELEIDDCTSWKDDTADKRFTFEQAIKQQQTNASIDINSQPRSTPDNSQGMKLPKLQIEKFKGEVLDWQRFWDQFDQAVHKNKQISEVTKFSYLRSLLEDVALEAIAGRTITAANYQGALETLRERFGRKELIIHYHMTKLLKMTPIKEVTNSKPLRKLYDECVSHINGLEALEVTSEKYGCLLGPVVMQLLPEEMILDWRRRSTTRAELYELETMLEKLRNEVEGLEDLEMIKRENGKTLQKNLKEEKKFQPSTTMLHTNTEEKNSNTRFKGERRYNCIFCESKEHKSANCNEAKTLEEKIEAVKKNGCCFRCLGRQHTSRECRSQIICRNCKRKHHTQICNQKGFAREAEGKVEEKSDSKVLHVAETEDWGQKKMQLQIVWAWAEGKRGREKVRCILDNGSQRSFIRYDVSRRIGAPKVGKEYLTVYGVGHMKEARKEYTKVKIVLKSLLDEKQQEIELLEIDNVCGPVKSHDSQFGSQENLKFPRADRSVTGEERCSVEILIGLEAYWTIVTGRCKRLSKTAVLSETIFGWSTEGMIECEETTENNSSVLNCIIEDASLDEWAKQLWTLEAIGIQEKRDGKFTKCEEDVHENFQKTIVKEKDRYSIRLPWKRNADQLDDNFATAKERLNKLIKRFRQEPELYQKYKTAMEDYINLGHAEEVQETQLRGKRTFYLPHHAVIKEDRITTKVRIVFDASSHKKGHRSLNESLWPGPNLNPDMVRLLIQFRTNKVALTADIEKAFLQVELAEKDRDATRLLWIRPDWEIRRMPTIYTLRMTRVLFGATCSPYLLAATVRYHTKQKVAQFPEASEMISNSLYVDDLITGAENDEKADKIRQEVTNIQQEAGMCMKKWLTNSKVLYEKWEKSEIEQGTLEKLNIQSIKEESKVLGLIWDPQQDILTLQSKPLKELIYLKQATKRKVLKGASRLFDPLGIVTPVAIQAKVLFQRIWELGIAWDTPIPENLEWVWKTWCQDMQSIHEIRIPRYVPSKKDDGEKRQLHVFCDASQKAYGAVVYIKVKVLGNIQTEILLSKGRVAPIKRISLPRLELLGTLIGARLVRYIRDIPEFEDIQVQMWSDSQVAIHWIQGEVNKWKPFVANRVSEIQAIIAPSAWKYCRSKDNPADFISKGESLQKLMDCDLWWHGPKWLKESETEWPLITLELPEEGMSEMKRNCKTTILMTTENSSEREDVLQLSKYGNLNRVLRITAWMMRMKANRLKKQERHGKTICAEELNNALVYWIGQVQRSQFANEIAFLTNKDETSIGKDSKLRKFNPYIDKKGILRIGGRLQETNLTEEQKHPIILPSKHRFVELLITEFHQRTYHGGVLLLLTELRKEYWILKARQVIKKIIWRCLKCRKQRLKSGDAIEAQLPADRGNPTAPFEITGIDFAGPIFAKDQKAEVKTYVALFTCATTRAVHLELVQDLSTETFLRALRRFFARRGKSRIIYTDNAKTFKRADQELKWIWENIEKGNIEEFCASWQVKWNFIAEKAAWWDGFWERMVQVMKRILRRTLGRACLVVEELATVLTEVEAVINARPISYVSDEPDEIEPLTPAHFLLENRPTIMSTETFPKMKISTGDKEFTRRWRHRQMILTHLWKRWAEEYLMQLKSLHERRLAKHQVAVKEGEIVLVHESQRPKHLWKLARVKHTFTGRDGAIRSCVVRLSDGTELRRPVQLLFPIEQDV